jgi:hypothetical protein
LLVHNASSLQAIPRIVNQEFIQSEYSFFKYLLILFKPGALDINILTQKVARSFLSKQIKNFDWLFKKIVIFIGRFFPQILAKYFSLRTIKLFGESS